MKALGLVLVAVVLLAGGAAPARTQGLPEPEPIPVKGTYVHAASGMTFPTAVADFRRTNIYKFDVQALDVGVNYDLTGLTGRILISVYVYPAPPLAAGGDLQAARAAACRREFDLRAREIVTFHPGARMIQTRVVPARSGEPTPGRMGTFAFDHVSDGERVALHSELYIFCFVGGGWAFEYRVTHQQSFAAAPLVAAFIDQLKWTVKPQP